MRQRTATLLAFAFFVAAAILATYPLILSPGTKIAGGLGDPLLNAIVLAWDADRARHAFHGFWDALFLYPHRHALAYAEPLISVAIFTTPIEWLSGNPLLAYNVAYIGSYALAGFGMFLLARDLWGRTDAALLAGLAFALTPYRLAQTTHLQVLLNGWMPIGLWALHRYFATGARRWMAAFAAVFVLQGLSNGYYFYFFLIAVAVMAAVELAVPRIPRARVIGDFALAGAGIFAAIAPIFFVYYRLQRDNGFIRAADELGGLSAQLTDYFRVADGAWTWGGLIPSGEGERQLFHGFVVLAFALVGACTIARPAASTKAGSWTRSIVTYTLMTIAAVWLSMGPGTLRPYGLLYRFLPGFNGLRVPARLSAVVIVALAALAGAGLAWVLARLPKSAALVMAVALGAVIIVEGQHGIGLSDVVSRRDRSWDRVAYDWMKSGPPGAALELNITQTDDFHPYTMIYQLNTLWHGHPIVNGYSGWKSMLQELLGGPASPLNEPDAVPGVLRGLRAIGVRYVLLHDDTFPDAEARERLVGAIRAAHDQIAEEHRWQGVWAWRLQDLAPRPAIADAGLHPLDPTTFDVQASHQRSREPNLFDGDIDTRWLTGVYQDGSEWIEITLPHPTDVARVQILTSPRSQLSYPRGLAIESVDAAGATRTLFEGSIVDRFVEAVALNEQQAPVNIDLPANQTRTLRIRQTGHATVWWVVDELKLWAR
jgi:hypothetical protein